MFLSLFGEGVDLAFRIGPDRSFKFSHRDQVVGEMAPIHEVQLLSYVKLSGIGVGLLINFNVRVLVKGVRRIVNDFPHSA